MYLRLLATDTVHDLNRTQIICNRPRLIGDAFIKPCCSKSSPGVACIEKIDNMFLVLCSHVLVCIALSVWGPSSFSFVRNLLEIEISLSDLLEIAHVSLHVPVLRNALFL